MNRAARIGIVVVSVVIFCYSGLGTRPGRATDDKAYKSLTVYGEVLRRSSRTTWMTPNMHTVTAGSLHGLLESLDTPIQLPHAAGIRTNTKRNCRIPVTGETGLTLAKRFRLCDRSLVLSDSPEPRLAFRQRRHLRIHRRGLRRGHVRGQALNLLSGQPGTASKWQSFAVEKPAR